jgi:hypothetical protein
VADNRTARQAGRLVMLSQNAETMSQFPAGSRGWRRNRATDAIGSGYSLPI